MTNTRHPLLALVGGFLGAGKTTLILRASEILRREGLRVAIITNDQDEGLVDTRLSGTRNIDVREVAGACFCCRFSGLVDAAAALSAFHPDVIFAEPVGSCVDISATTLQPLKAFHCDTWKLAPYTVLIDPQRAAQVSAGAADSDVGFLFRNQIAEADLLCVTKIDQSATAPLLPVPVDFQLSALTGKGVREWLDEIMNSTRVVGARILDVDYARYADAEAALGWLNLHAEISMREPISPATLVGPLLDYLDNRLTEASIGIAHLKVFDRAESGWVKASLCRNGDEPLPEGDLSASPALRHELVVNLRALGEPELLRSLVAASLAPVNGEVAVKHLGAFRPAAPKPEHRFREPQA